MAKTDREEGRAAMAAEYVIGTLDAAERATAESLIETDPEFAASVDAWRARLAALDDVAPEVTPPEQLRARVLAAATSTADAETDGTAGPPDAAFQIALLKKQLRFWQGTAVAGAAIAACLLLLPILPATSPVTEERFVAVLQAEASDPAFVATVDLERGTISIRRVGSDAPPGGHDYELWAVGGGRTAPESLGVVDNVVRIPAEALRESIDGTVLAVSLEPEGGSPTGQPTGPVLFTGALVATQ